jgi:hypothetical protein
MPYTVAVSQRTQMTWETIRARIYSTTSLTDNDIQNLSLMIQPIHCQGRDHVVIVYRMRRHGFVAYQK